LQGLRAVAVLLVALNHANTPLLGGGYIGVDVFFVLSGYFITGLLLRDGFGHESKLGQISIPRFYARRARRLLPAAGLTLVVTSLAVYIVYDKLGYDLLSTKSVLEDSVASSLFFANFHFIATANNYFVQATTTLPSPFRHFWSLSIEEQLYLVWPSVLAVTFLGCRRLGARVPSPGAVMAQRRLATWLIGLFIAVTGLASLAWSIQDTAANPAAAYFSTPVRVWEFGCGAALALLAARSETPGLPRAWLGWLGLAMIATAAFVFSSHTLFPGWVALLPAAGTSLIILAGHVPARWGVHRPLASKPMTIIGDRSYAFYLWHFPVLIIAWQLAGHVLPVAANLALLVGAFALSSVTYACYENPLRLGRGLRGWRTAAMAAASISIALLAALLPITAVDRGLAAANAVSRHAPVAKLVPVPTHSPSTSVRGSPAIAQVLAAARAARNHAPLPKAIVPSLQELVQDRTSASYHVPAACEPQWASGASSKICRLGDATSSKVVVLLGDSHAGMWMPALVADARAQGFAVVPLDKPGCFLYDLHKNWNGWPCANWYHWVLAQDRRLSPVATIVSFQLVPSLQTNPSQTASMLRTVLGSVTHGVFLADPPAQTQQPATCISRPGADMGRCSTPVPDGYVVLVHTLSQMTAKSHHPAIPTLQWLCAGGICPMVINHTLTTRDKSHFTTEYSAELAPLLGPVLKSILTRLGRS
jgi:peptidoglycan/LPS O-acetylase OafA/YrhL